MNDTRYIIGDCHIHIALDGVDHRNAEERYRDGSMKEHVRRVLASYRDLGVTFLRDGGDKWGACAAAAAAAPEFGIDYRTPAFPIYRKGNYGSFIGRSYETERDYLSLIREAIDGGCDFIKLMASGIMDFSRGGELTGFGLPDYDLKGIIGAAHGEGLCVMVHVNGADNIKRALDAGADSIEHGFFIDSAGISMLRDSGSVWVPTIVPVAGIIGSGRYDAEVLRAIASRQKAAVAEAAEAGCLIAAGSDGGCGGVPHAVGLTDEVSILKEVLGGRTRDILRGGELAIWARFRRS